MNELKIKEVQKKALRKAKAEVARLNDLLIAARFWHDVSEVGIIEPEQVEQARVKKCRTGAIVCFVIAGIAALILAVGIFGCHTVHRVGRALSTWSSPYIEHQEK